MAVVVVVVGLGIMAAGWSCRVDGNVSAEVGRWEHSNAALTQPREPSWSSRHTVTCQSINGLAPSPPPTAPQFFSSFFPYYAILNKPKIRHARQSHLLIQILSKDSSARYYNRTRGKRAGMWSSSECYCPREAAVISQSDAQLGLPVGLFQLASSTFFLVPKRPAAVLP